MTDVTMNFTQYFGSTKRYDVGLISDAEAGGTGLEHPMLGKPDWSLTHLGSDGLPAVAPLGQIVGAANGLSALIKAFDRPGTLVVTIRVPAMPPRSINPNDRIVPTNMTATLNITIADAPAIDDSVKPTATQSAPSPI